MNIVTIDFDIIMAPSIAFYSHMASTTDVFNIPFTQAFPADFIHYQRLTKWLLSQIKNLSANDIIFISSHGQILDYINSQDVIINIDHHHDLGYPTDTKQNQIHCGNWAGYLLENNLISDYIWIKNENSNQNKLYENDIKQYNFSNYDLDKLVADKIICCLSPEWVPPQYRVLFFIWMDMLNEYYGVNYSLD